MDSSLIPQQPTFIDGLENPSVASLLERGLHDVQQGRDAEGGALLTLARAILSPDQERLAIELDTFIATHSKYQRAQQALQEASIRFAEVYTQQQSCVTTLLTLLPALIEETEAQRSPIQLLRSLYNDQASPSSPASPSLTGSTSTLPELSITCFGGFGVKRFDRTIDLCHNRSGQTILRYLMTQAGYRANMDVLMEVLWPNNEPDVARRKLQIAVYALRRSLNGDYSGEASGSYIVFKDRIYQLNPAVSFKSDVDDFLVLYNAGQQEAKREKAVTYYERACQLYMGPFLVEDLYADWSFRRREQLNQMYLAMCSVLADHYLQVGRYDAAAQWASTILNENRCDEAAHRQLIQVYAAQGRRSDALRQFQRCERVLLEELSVSPLPETVRVFQSSLNYEHPQPDEVKTK